MMEINILPVTKEMMAELDTRYPGYRLSITVPKELYNALKKNQRSLAYVISDFTHKDLSEDTVFEIVKAIWDKRRRLANSNLTLEKGRFTEMYQTAIDYNLAVPFHKGAARFYQEKLNITVPTHLIPPEMKTPPADPPEPEGTE